MGPPIRARHEQLERAESEVAKGGGAIALHDSRLENIKSYDPEKNGDYTGMCMPFGLMRSVNAPYPFQIMQNDKYVTFLFEQNN